jgi:2-polyprenyl-6-methoxyphenol hydroxylase-like FAD-dependent oxidoreductase
LKSVIQQIVYNIIKLIISDKMKKGIIIGGGIGGLATAIALAQKGIATTIYEQATELKEIGAGIWVAPNGLKVFDKLGFAEEIAKVGKVLDLISIVDVKGKPISVIDGAKVKAKHQFATTAISRAVLQNILLSKVKKESIVLGKRLKTYTQNKDGVTVEFEEGAKATADFLIVADGINSIGRFQFNKSTALRYSGQTCWRFVTDFNYPAEENGKMYEVWSNKKGLRVGYSQINEKETYMFITNYEKPDNKDNTTTIKQDLLSLCDEFPAIVKQLIATVAPEKIIRNDIYDFKPISTWIDGNVALLGDAAHATTPNLGQGACQAIEDAYVLAEELTSAKTIAQGLTNYQAKRMARAKFITDTAWRFSQITNTSGIWKNLLQSLIRLTPDSINEKQLDKIYAVGG